MKYEEFAEKYAMLFEQYISYDSNQNGSWEYEEQLGELCDEYPEFDKRYQKEFQESFTQP